MAHVHYNQLFLQLALGDLHLDTDDIRVLLLESATDLNPDDDTVAAVLARAGTTEATHTNYARQACTTETVAVDDPNDRAEWTHDPVDFGDLLNDGGGTVKGHLYFKFVTNDSDSIPLAYIDSGGYPATPGGGPFTMTPNAQGALQIGN